MNLTALSPNIVFTFDTAVSIAVALEKAFISCATLDINARILVLKRNNDKNKTCHTNFFSYTLRKNHAKSLMLLPWRHRLPCSQQTRETLIWVPLTEAHESALKIW